MRIVIIGGVAGGMSAAARLRRLLEDAEITVVERSGHVSYANCGLPYYVGGVIAEESDLLLQTPESLAARFRIDVKVHHEAIAIDRERKLVAVRSAGADLEQLPYDALVLSTGAAPIWPPIPGIERARALRTIEDVEQIHRDVDAAPRTCVVIGGGFIGLELAENLTRRGVATTIVEAAPQVLAPLDVEMAGLVEASLVRHGVTVETATTAVEITDDAVRLDDGRVVDADLVVAAIGVRPDVRLAEQAGLAIGPRGGIAVDRSFRTSDAAVFAIGDVAEKVDAIDGSATLVPLANLANHDGRLVADVIAGRAVRPPRAQGTAIVKVFGTVVAVTGWNERRARAAGRAVRVIHTHPSSHAGYYPGAVPFALKVVVDEETDELLGAQAVGGDGVDKRIDVLATAMRAGMTASELADLELAYAPPFGSAKDPLNMIGWIAENLRAGVSRTVQWHELDEIVRGGAQLVDVRTPEEHAAGTIPGAHNVPLDELRDQASSIPPGRIVVFCAVGQRSHVAARLLASLGREVAYLDGGFATWSRSPVGAALRAGAPANRVEARGPGAASHGPTPRPVAAR